MEMKMERQKILEKRQDFVDTLLIIENLVEGEKIDRFKFTSKEKSALLFVSELLSIHIKEMQ